MSDTPIWEQTVWDLLIDPDESLEMYQAYSDLKFMKIDIGNSLDYEALGALLCQIIDTVLESLSWMARVGSSEMQDKLDRYRER